MIKTYQLCTLSDYNYIHQALAMFSSVKNKNIFLHYLCLDDKTFEKIKSLNIKNLKAYHINDFINNDKKLLDLKNLNYSYFCYSLASYFINYLFTNNENFENITYVDSDIYFHQDINLIFKELGEKHIGLFRHRHLPFNLNNGEGCFNVGVVYFKNTKQSRDVLSWWADAVLNLKYPALATCGDQKYLDMFPFLCPSELLFVDGAIGHGAPWHWQLYNYSNFLTKGDITWNGQDQKLVFSHFSKFKFDEQVKNYIPSIIYYQYTPFEMYSYNKDLKFIYDTYFLKIQEVTKNFNL